MIKELSEKEFEAIDKIDSVKLKIK